MNEHTERVLDYTHIRRDLQAYTVTPMGAALAAQLQPLSDRVTLMQQLQETSEIVDLLIAGDAPPLSPLIDLRAHLAMTAIDGFYLEALQLLEVAYGLESMQRLRRYAYEEAHRALRVGRRLAPMADFGILLREIRSAIDEQGHVRDQASAALQQVRQTLQRLRQRIQRHLQELLTEHRAVVQDALVTIRNDRFVIPLKADFRRALRGIVHGESASGATVYVEPDGVVDLNNQLLHAQAEEERAVREVLRHLTRRVAVQSVGLTQALRLVGEVDFLVAKGRLSLQMHGTAPRFTAEPRLQLLAARHPLLASPVPIDVHIGPESHILVVTGPNTGGKTALLKTVGLLVLMAQSGLHIPASAESVLPVFSEVFVDLGDEQSLQQNLSTFSAHLANICTMMQQATPRSLVLLDELGAGTDPLEGGPLGIAILDYFLQRGAMTVATTHHSTIKTFAMSTPEVTCATVAFDAETLQPRYRLVYGLPGRSQAFVIAEKLGIPPAVIGRAQHEMGVIPRRSEQLLAHLESQRQALDVEQQRMQAERAEIAQLHTEAQAVLTQAQAEELRVRQSLQAEGYAFLKSVRQELDATLAALRRQAPAGQTFAFPQAIWQRAEEAIASLAVASPEADLPVQPLQVGEHVRVRGLQITGRVLTEVAANGNVQVAVGNKTLTVAASDLERAQESTAGTRPEPGRRAVSRRRQRSAPEGGLAAELRLMGSTVDDALPAVEQYLDRACRQGLPSVRIIHGIGSGRLRHAIHEFLQHHPLVRRFQAGEGGGGTTVVELEG
jgi:DNA mismatch repair protein MutS2